MIKLKVNGKNHQFNGDPDIPLLWVLRDELDLRGMEFVTWTALQPLWSNL
jgi:isoquinoline 1-oxidoreductase subunit alpha